MMPVTQSHYECSDAGEVSAWHYRTRQPVRLQWKKGKITALDPAPTSPPRDLWIAPPLLDVQVNGYAGIDFQQDHLTLDALLAAAGQLRAAGCTNWLLTLITDDWSRLMARLRHLRELRTRSDELQQAIVGWHIEGPFLSAEPGFCGAHDPAVMCDPRAEQIRELRDATGSDPVLLTIAPERLDAIAAIALAASLGLKVSLGHTNAPRMRLEQAIRAGATGFTHLGNGCPRQLDRHDNILWRVFETPGLLVGLIPDGIHVSGPLFRLIHREVGGERIYYTTDAMAAAGAPPGRYRLGRLELEVAEDEIVRLPGTPNFAGSALRPMEGIFRAADMLDCSWQEVWPRFSETPARLMGLAQGLAVGGPADFCLLEVTPENQLLDLKVCVGGAMGAD
jgi:N-acetylglucosamine-6-phosphate deacetylase